MNYDVIVVGCGLSGSVIAREFAETGKTVFIIERRDHIGGNMYDYVNEDGVLVHKYGPHTFHTKKKELFDYMARFSEWDEYILTCGSVIDGKCTPTPFNFQTIDDFFDKHKAEKIKSALKEAYPDQEFATVLELLDHDNDLIREYAQFLFDKDYSLYTAKQWGISPKEIDKSVLKRVPIRFNYDVGYFDDEYQYMPRTSYKTFFDNILEHENITVKLGQDALKHLSLHDGRIYMDGDEYKGILVYTGAIDELFECKYGRLPYRSLRFEWETEDKKSFQDAPVVAYPEAEGYTRITEYTKLPVQNVGNRTVFALEYPLQYDGTGDNEPYYPVLTDNSLLLYDKYRRKAEKYDNLILCGRLADFRCYNMDQALDRAINSIRWIVK